MLHSEDEFQLRKLQARLHVKLFPENSPTRPCGGRAPCVCFLAAQSGLAVDPFVGTTCGRLLEHLLSHTSPGLECPELRAL